MSLRLEMLQVARLAPRLLSDSIDLVVRFVESQQHSSGGFKNRVGEPDLYYTVFGLESLAATRTDLPIASTIAYLRRVGDGESLDLVHLACLARCWANMPPGSLDEPRRARLLERLGQLGVGLGSDTTLTPWASRSVYACFLIAGAYQDLGAAPPDPDQILSTLDSLRTDDGAFSNHPAARAGSTPATAAAVTLIRYLGATPPSSASAWLLARCHAHGGFFAAPAAPIPDLLSTATALHALAGMQASIESVKEPCLDFVDSLWTNRGSFHGSWSDDALDCEYTYYGLLALGHLSL